MQQLILSNCVDQRTSPLCGTIQQMDAHFHPSCALLFFNFLSDGHEEIAASSRIRLKED